MLGVRRGGLLGIVLLLGFLTGCSLFLPRNTVNDDTSIIESSSSSWLVAAQGQGGPPDCVKDLAPGQAKKLVEKALKDKPEIQLLKQALERRGKKLVLSRAHGCQVKGKAKGQGLSAQQETATEVTLIEVPAGSDAALYLLENEPAQESNSWAAFVGADEGGQWLTQLEVGLEVDGASPEEPVGVDLFLPDDAGTQEIASQVQPLLSMTAGSQGVRAQELDWSQAQVVILDADQEEATALVVVPEMSSSTGQTLLPGGMSFDLDRAVHTAVKVQRVSTESGGSGKWQILPTPVSQLPVIKPVPKPTPTPPKLPAPKPAPPSPPPPPAPPVQLGTAIKPVFDYCPYGYSGPVTALSKVMCQNSWELWYQKEWKSGRIAARSREIASTASSAIYQEMSTPPAIFARGEGANVLASGLGALEKWQIEELLRDAQAVLVKAARIETARSTQGSQLSAEAVPIAPCGDTPPDLVFQAQARIAAVALIPVIVQNPEVAALFTARAEAVLFAICTNSDAVAHFIGRLDQILTNPLEFNSLLGELTVASEMVLRGWTLVDFSMPKTWQQGVLPGFSGGSTVIDVVGTKEIPGLGKVAAFIEVKSGPTSGVISPERSQQFIDYARQIDRYIEAASVIKNTKEIAADTYSVVMIMDGLTNAAAAQRLANQSADKAARNGIVVVVVYCVANCGTPSAQFAFATNTQDPTGVAQAQQIACAIFAFSFCASPAADIAPPPSSDSLTSGLPGVVISSTACSEEGLRTKTLKLCAQ